MGIKDMQLGFWDILLASADDMWPPHHIGTTGIIISFVRQSKLVIQAVNVPCGGQFLRIYEPLKGGRAPTSTNLQRLDIRKMQHQQILKV